MPRNTGNACNRVTRPGTTPRARKASAIGPDWTIAEWLRGSLGYGQARCVRRDGVRALATFSRAQAQSLDRVTQKLKVSARGVVPMLDVRTAGDYAVLFEAEPPGLPLATAMFPLHVDVAAQLFGKLLEIVADGERMPVRPHWHTDVYEERDGRWRIVWSQATVVR